MATNTPNYAFLLPTVGGDTDLWGGFLNQNWSDLDDLLSGTGTVDGVDIINGTGAFNTLTALAGTLDGMTITDSSVQANSLEALNEITEGRQALAGLTPAVDPENGGTLATWTLTASQEHVPAITLLDGESITLLITAATGATINWGPVVFVNGVPTLDPATENLVELFRIGATTYGIFVGSV